MVTSIGKVTGDGSTHPVRCIRAEYQYDGFPRRLKVDVVLRYRKLTDLQRGVKHFVFKRNETSPEAHLSFIHKCLMTD